MRRARTVVLVALSTTAATTGVAACNAVLGLGDLRFVLDGGRGTGGGSATGSGGAGCTDAAECPAVPAGLCASLGTVTCTNGICGVTYQAGPSPSQQYGSCETNWCDDAGTEMEISDAGNVYVNSGDPCIQWPCVVGVAGMPSLPLQPQNMPCTGPNTTPGFCEFNPFSGTLVCAECNPSDTTQTTCSAVLPGDTCASGTCVPAHCTNKMFDPNLGETDVDCGGGGCLPCTATKMCVSYKDCASLVCTAGTCQMNTCTDGEQNGAETDKDCGGPSCPACGNGLNCFQPSDCTSGVCLPSGLGYNSCALPTCTDGVQNGGETGVDCGGSDDGVACPPAPTPAVELTIPPIKVGERG